MSNNTDAVTAPCMFQLCHLHCMLEHTLYSWQCTVCLLCSVLVYCVLCTVLYVVCRILYNILYAIYCILYKEICMFILTHRVVHSHSSSNY